MEDLKSVQGGETESPDELGHGTATNIVAHSRGKSGVDTSEQASVASSDMIKDVRGSVERIIGRIDAWDRVVLVPRDKIHHCHQGEINIM